MHQHYRSRSIEAAKAGTAHLLDRLRVTTADVPNRSTHRVVDVVPALTHDDGSGSVVVDRSAGSGTAVDGVAAMLSSTALYADAVATAGTAMTEPWYDDSSTDDGGGDDNAGAMTAAHESARMSTLIDGADDDDKATTTTRSHDVTHQTQAPTPPPPRR
jgi:hypothetical protein